ncbi:DUF1501 domain-containing protein [Sungkyunkwania multivorans]|uniref:DUF1501 domain-containing protein n=1 Tax=Sungkyunkwania multivorans TaxID=1173618 RepID=A0ABW3D175_9FLAO
MCNHHIIPGFRKEDSNHNAHHEEWSRRSFIQALGLFGGGAMMLGSRSLTASNPSPLSAALSAAETDRILVIIRLKGGNDGLNTIIPLSQYDDYANLRPNIRIQEGSYFNLSDEYAMPNFMNSLESFWGDGKMKVVHGVGYPDQNLSHFRSSDIWASAEPTTEIQSGWLGRYFESLYPDYLANPPEKPAAVQIGSIGNLIFDGVDNNYAFAVANPDQLNEIASSGNAHDLDNLPDCAYGEQLGFMRGITNTTYRYAGVIHDAYTAASNASTYGDNELAAQLSIVARLIKGNLGSKVYMVSIDGFDTHANQEVDHQQLLSSVADTITAFYSDLEAGGMDSEVLSMTISEFGRRVEQNGSQGTDHGSCAPMMLFGPALNGNGFVGNHPSLTNLDQNGNMFFQNDFRQIYATILQEWLCLDAQMVNDALLGEQYESAPLGFGCSTLSVDDFSDIQAFQHFATYEGNQTMINYIMPRASRVVIKLYNIIGQEVATLQDSFSLEGKHAINVRQASGQRLATGQYVYRISAGNNNFSKSILVK